MQVSYLSDALGDMARAGLHLLRGGREAVFAFEDEPGQHRWVLSRGDLDFLSVRVFWFRETLGSRPIEYGREVFSCNCALLDFVGPMCVVLHQVLCVEGMEGYKRRWQNHGFPLDTYIELRHLLRLDPVRNAQIGSIRP